MTGETLVDKPDFKIVRIKDKDREVEIPTNVAWAWQSDDKKCVVCKIMKEKVDDTQTR